MPSFNIKDILDEILQKKINLNIFWFELIRKSIDHYDTKKSDLLYALQNHLAFMSKESYPYFLTELSGSTDTTILNQYANHFKTLFEKDPKNLSEKSLDQLIAYIAYVSICRNLSLEIKQNLRVAQEEFMELLKKFNQPENSLVSWCLGFMYGQGILVNKRDDQQAITWYQKAAEQGHAVAQYNLGMSYEYGGFGIALDYQQAMSWYRKSAEQGYDMAQYSYASYYTKGLFITEDFKKAGEWYQKVAIQGNVSAQRQLGVYYEGGYGVEKNEQQAFDWYRKAAEQGDLLAQYDLGRCYEKGIGVSQDKDLALYWYEKVAEQGYPLGKTALENLINEIPRLKL